MNAKTVPQLIQDVNAYAADCADAHTTTQRLRFNTHGCLVYPTRESEYSVSMQGTLNNHAVSQVVERLDAPPMTWLTNPKRCPIDLRAKILNNLAVTRQDDRLMIRHRGGDVRAVLSAQYTPFDNVDFIDLVAQAVDSMGVDAQVHRPTIGDELSAYILIPSITFDSDPAYRTPGRNGNGGLHPAVYISNSEIGTGSARTAGGLFRAVCSNGAIYGWKSDTNMIVRHRYLSVSTMRAVVAAGIADALRMSEQAAKAYVAAQEVRIEMPDLKGIISEWAGKYGLGVSIKDNWLKAVTAEASDNGRSSDPRLLDLFNAATYTAKTVEGVYQREMVERMAGDLLAVRTRNYVNR